MLLTATLQPPTHTARQSRKSEFVDQRFRTSEFSKSESRRLQSRFPCLHSFAIRGSDSLDGAGTDSSAGLNAWRAAAGALGQGLEAAEWDFEEIGRRPISVMVFRTCNRKIYVSRAPKPRSTAPTAAQGARAEKFGQTAREAKRLLQDPQRRERNRAEAKERAKERREAKPRERAMSPAARNRTRIQSRLKQSSQN
jgi:hypothetical protein